MIKMQTQIELLQAMEQDFKISRKIFLNIKTGWYDRNKFNSNLVFAKDITIDQIQGRYRLNLDDNLLKVQEFFFDAEWSSFTKDGRKIKVITKDITDKYFSRLKRASKRLLFVLFKYIPKDFIYIRASGTGLHLVFFLKGLKNMDEWALITNYLIHKSSLPNTKNASSLVFGLDKDTILSSDRKIAEFGSWNKLKRDFKEEVDYLNYATYLSVDDFLKAEHYPFCSDFKSVRYPKKFQYFNLPTELLEDAKNADLDNTNDSVAKPIPSTDLTPINNGLIAKFNGKIPFDDPVYSLVKYCKCYWNMLRHEEASWYARQFLVKFLKYVLKLNREQIL